MTIKKSVNQIILLQNLTGVIAILSIVIFIIAPIFISIILDKQILALVVILPFAMMAIGVFIHCIKELITLSILLKNKKQLYLKEDAKVIKAKIIKTQKQKWF